MMNETERRRKLLLEQTKARYSEQNSPPAVHPRYGAAYRQIYGDVGEAPEGTFALRAFLCALLFAGFVAMDYRDEKILHVDSGRIAEIVAEDTDVAEVWKNL